MKTIAAASAACLAMSSAAFADGHDAGGEGPPPGLPPAIATTINLSKAGLTLPFYADVQKGFTGIRAGADGVRIGTAGASGITSGYQHNTMTIVGSVSANKLIRNGSSYLTFSLSGNQTDDSAAATKASTQIPGFTVGYENLSNPNAAWSLGLTYENRTTSLANAPVETGAQTLQARFAYVRKLNDNWGIGNQTFLTLGRAYVEDPGGRANSTETEIYTQFELVGAFSSDQLGFLPEAWNFHPTFGVSYNTLSARDQAGTTTTTEDGSVWAKAVFARDLAPGGWTPNATLGIEHVYRSSTGRQFMNEDTYGIIGAGALFIGENGSFNISFEHRSGLNGNRRENLIVTGYSIDF